MYIHDDLTRQCHQTTRIKGVIHTYTAGIDFNTLKNDYQNKNKITLENKHSNLKMSIIQIVKLYHRI